MQHIDQATARDQMVHIGELCYQKGYICGLEGNFSLRLDEKTLLTTPAGCNKGRLKPSSLVVTNLQGVLLDRPAGSRPSTELKMHLAAYAARPDVRAIVHAHPAHAVAFTIAGLPLNRAISPEAVLTLGGLATASYATPSTQALSDSLEDLLPHNKTIVLAHHGALTMGDDLFDAFYRLESLEHHARTLYLASTLATPGTLRMLSREQLIRLYEISTVYGMTPMPPSDLQKALDGWLTDHNHQDREQEEKANG